MSTKLRTTLFARIDPDLKQSFTEKAERFGGVSSVLRELCSAWVEDRLTIQPPENLESLYDEPRS